MQVSGFPYVEIEFDKHGGIHDPTQFAELQDLVVSGGITDLLVISHGWNNDMAEARDLYSDLLGNLRKRMNAGGTADRKIGVLAILWPSKKFAESDLIPSGAAGLGDELSDQDLIDQIDTLADAFDDAEPLLQQLRDLVPRLEFSPAAQDEFVDAARALFAIGGLDDELSLELPTELLEMAGAEMVDKLGVPFDEDEIAPGGDAAALDEAGGAAGFGILSGIRSGAQRVLNLLTFYKMKARAGEVGQGGVRAVLEDVKARAPGLKLHLAGHSFGARLVTAAVRGGDTADRIEVDSLTLLQAAYSHNGLGRKFDGKNDGYFRLVVEDKRVRGPVVITHTRNDKAVGIAYPMASRLAGQDAAWAVGAIVGGPESPYGGMGSNGAQKTPEASPGLLGAPGSTYNMAAGKVLNLRADDHIKNHGDVGNEAVAGALLAAIHAT